jgi:hypothetical protein
MPFPNPGDLIKPWDWNFVLDAVVWFLVILLTAWIFLWTRAGRDRKNTPDQVGRNVEDFAGITQESNGQVPIFLFIFYLVVAVFAIGYPIVTLIFNYNY